MTALDLYLLRAYLDGELDAAESEAFELLLLERPDLAELVDADSALRIGLAGEAQAASTGRAVEVVAPAPSNVVPLRPRPAWPALAAAASVMLAVGLGGGLLLRPAPPAADGAQLVYVDKTRSISAVPTASVDPQQPVVLMVPVARVDDCAPDFELLQAGREPLAATATPDEFGYASLVLAAGVLQAGRAEVRVRCGAGEAAVYALDVTLAAPR